MSYKIMKVSEALIKRQSTRAFLDKPVSKKTIDQILELASHAPSGANTQPWQVVVVMGEKKRQLQHLIETAFRSGEKAHMDYQYYPKDWQEPYKARRKSTGLQLYNSLAIGKEDKEKRLEQWAANYRAFDAPVMMLFFMDRILETGSFVDYGAFLQSIMLAAVEAGLATCPQAALGEYPIVVKRFLGYPETSVLVCGMALGYPDKQARVNSYRTPREKANHFTRYYE